MTNDTEDRLLTARERGDPATILDERHVDKAAWPTGNQVRAADLVAQGRCLHCVPLSCITALPGPSGGLYRTGVLLVAGPVSRGVPRLPP
jgi:hypothetical protein